MTEDKMVRWCHQINGHEFEQALGDGEGQGILVSCSPWDHKESDTTEQLNNSFFFLPNSSCKDFQYRHTSELFYIWFQTIAIQ